MEIKIALPSGGGLLLDGQPTDLEQLDLHLSKTDRARDQILLYKESPDSNPLSIDVARLVVKHRLAISFSTKADYSDYVDQFGQSHPRTAAPGPTPMDRYAPFMPDVDINRSVDEVFATARTAASKAPNNRGIVLVSPDRAVSVLAVPPRSAEMDARLPKLPDVPSDRPLNIAVIAATGILSAFNNKPPDLHEVSKAIPFLGFLIAFGYAGHRVWIFEGHASALASGLEHAEILLIDSGMLPFLQKDWMAVAQRVMDPPRRVLLHSRERHTLLTLVADSTPKGWSYAEPNGEASYVNCLLTTLAKAGFGASVEITAGSPLPNLAGLARHPAQLEWIAKLPFRYEDLNAAKAIEVLNKGQSLLPAMKKTWQLKTVLIDGGRQRSVQFALNHDGGVLSVRVAGSES